MIFKLFYVFCTLFLLLGCEKGQDFATLCEENPNICQEFEEDSWCKRERISVGFANLNHKIDPSEEHKFDQLISYESYGKCMQLASKIEHVKLKHKKTMRLGNVSKAQARLKAISDKTKGLKHPSLLYFHWSRYLDKDALRDFLALENTKQLETPSLQFNLATYYAKIDQNKTLNLLYHALELTDKEEMINTEIFKSISTIFADKKKQKQAYIWSKVLMLHTPEDETVTDESLVAYAKAFDLDPSFLDLVAEHTLKTILEGQFKPPKS